MMSNVTQQWSDDKLVKSLINEVLPRLTIHTDSAKAIAGKINSLLASQRSPLHHPQNPIALSFSAKLQKSF